MSKHSITFSRQALYDYKLKSIVALVNGHDTFIHNGSLVKVDDAEKLVDKFMPHFLDAKTQQVTLDYNF